MAQMPSPVRLTLIYRIYPRFSLFSARSFLAFVLSSCGNFSLSPFRFQNIFRFWFIPSSLKDTSIIEKNIHPQNPVTDIL